MYSLDLLSWKMLIFDITVPCWIQYSPIALRFIQWWSKPLQHWVVFISVLEVYTSILPVTWVPCPFSSVRGRAGGLETRSMPHRARPPKSGWLTSMPLYHRQAGRDNNLIEVKKIIASYNTMKLMTHVSITYTCTPSPSIKSKNRELIFMVIAADPDQPFHSYQICMESSQNLCQTHRSLSFPHIVYRLAVTIRYHNNYLTIP